MTQADWGSWPALREFPVLPVEPAGPDAGTVLVVVDRPGAEEPAAGLLARLGRAGYSVEVVAVPPGETLDPDELRDVGLLVSRWSDDQGAGHERAGDGALGRAVADTGARHGIRVLQFPLDAWTWAHPGDPRLPWHRAVLDGEGGLYFDVSDPAAGFPPTLPGSWFEDFYSAGGGWDFDEDVYETRKRALLLASLPRPRFPTALEVGCSTGAITAELARRCDRVLALDASATALDAARRRLSGVTSVDLRRAEVPRDWPAGGFDLVVLSEVAYYCVGADLADLLARATAALTADGVLIACHWRHFAPDHPTFGDEVHRVLATVPGLSRLVAHVEEDFLLDVYVRSPAVSVARAAGLLDRP